MNDDTRTTLIIVWVFTWVAMLLMMLRLLLRKIRGQKLVLGDYLTMGAMLCALARLGLIHVVLIWGSNNVSAAFRKTHHFTADEIYRREIGGKLTLVNRVFYNSYLWLQKLVLLDFSRNIIKQMKYEKLALNSILAFLAITYVVVQVVTFTECDPINHYWMVVPDPGTCTQAQVQLIALGVLNIVTDAALMALPLPVLLRWKQSMKQKFQIIVLFTLGLFIITITIVRLPQNHNKATAQVNRTTWASTELLVAAIAVNAPALYALMRKSNPKSHRSYTKQTQGNSALQTFGSMPGRRATVTGGSRIRKDVEYTVTSSYKDRVEKQGESWDDDEIPLGRIEDPLGMAATSGPSSCKSDGGSVERLPHYPDARPL